MALITFNQAPYFDDFSPSKNYLKVLFKPGRNLQIRELNNFQSMFQEQIKRFAANMFRNGARVSGARSRYFDNAYFVLSGATATQAATIKPGYVVVGTSGVEAIVVHCDVKPDGSVAVFFSYSATGTNGTSTQIAENEGVVIKTPEGVTLLAGTATAFSSGKLFMIDEGTFYYEGHFINNESQSITVNFAPEDKECRIGFDVIEQIIDYVDDPSLLDNASGYPSFNSPGADRYKLSLFLTKRSADPEDGARFIILAKINNRGLSYIKSDTDYAVWGDTLAKRTYEESGNYTLNPIDVTIMNHKATGPNDPLGYDVNGDPNNYVAKISPHVSYVQGHRVERIVETYAIAPRGRNTLVASNLRKSIGECASFIATPTSASSASPNNLNNGNLTFAETISLYDGPIVSGNTTGSLIGTAKVISVVPSGSSFKYIVDSVKMNPGQSASNVKSMKTATTNFFASVSGTFEVTNFNVAPSLVNVSDGLPIKTMSNSALGAGGSVDAVVRKKYWATADATGNVTFTVSGTDLLDPDLQLVVNVKTGSTFKNQVPTAVTLSGGTQVSMNVDVSNANKEVCAIINTIMTNIPIKTKTLRTKTDTFTNIQSMSVFTLSRSDILRITGVKLVNFTTPTDQIVVDVAKFNVFNGQTSTHYEVGSLTLRPNESLAPGINLAPYDLVVDYEYLQHSISEGVFVVDSYAGLDYSRIPSYISPTNEVISLATAIDFRPTVVSGEIVSPCPVVNTTKSITFDAEMYLPRVDLLAINKDGEVYIKTGTPGINPKAPKANDGDMGIFELSISPYTYDLSGIVAKRIENKRYTMRDIGKIETRIKNMEYYTALSLLEKSAESMSIKDANGLDRFKNGFIADDFSKYQAGDIGSSEFRAGLDRTYRELRPSFVARNRKFSFNETESVNVVNKAGMLMIDYDEVEYERQPFATKNISINPYFCVTKKGSMTLTPNNDTWADVTNEPNISFTIDSGVDAFRNVANRAGLLNTEWGSWHETNRTVFTVTDPGDTTKIRFGTRITAEEQAKANERNLANPAPSSTMFQTTSTTTTVTERKEGLAKSVGDRMDSHSWQNVSDVKITTFMRPIVISFRATGLSPETKHYAFFDGEAVGSQTRTQAGQYGEDLLSDASGELAGQIRIDERQFYVGERNFVLATTPDFEQINTDANYSTASATFYAGGLDVTKQQINMNVVTPTWNEQIVSDNRITITNNTTVGLTEEEKFRRQETERTRQDALAREMRDREAAQAAAARANAARINSTVQTVRFIPPSPGDPVAQSFTPSHDMFVTSIDLYFAAVDRHERDFWVSIRKLDNGYPTFTDIALKSLNTSSVTTSDTAATPFKVTFDYPVFCEKGVEYCFVVGGWSPGTRIWVSKVGDPLIDDPNRTVETQPSLGSSFRSQNGTTWNAEQYEDIKYTMYCARFKSQSMTAVMNTINEFEVLPEDPFECQLGMEEVRVYMKNHGLTSGDKFTINMFENEQFVLETEGGNAPVPGQNIYSSSGRAEITDVEIDQANAQVKVRVTNMVGFIKTGDAFTCDTIDLISNEGSTTTRLSSVKGTVVAGPIEEIAGIPIEQLVGEHSVFVADTQDTFVFKIDAANVPTSSGRFGGKNSRIAANTKYEVFNVSGAYMLYGSSEQWDLRGVGHNPENGIFSRSNYQEFPEKTFTPGSDVHLDQPYKMANDSNESISIKSKKSVAVRGRFGTPSVWVSPVINLNTFSMITVSNNIDWLDETQMDVNPFRGTHFKGENLTTGSEPYKYVTKMVTLKKPASDLMIAFDVYKDKDADFEVYYKMLYAHESKNIDLDVEWTQVPVTVKRDSVDLEDRIEYELLMSEVFGSGWSGKEFSAFKIKLVGRAKNTAKPPLFQNFRAIAVT